MATLYRININYKNRDKVYELTNTGKEYNTIEDAITAMAMEAEEDQFILADCTYPAGSLYYLLGKWDSHKAVDKFKDRFSGTGLITLNYYKTKPVFNLLDHYRYALSKVD